MALIWRSIVEVTHGDLRAAAPALMRDWGSRKVRDAGFALPQPGGSTTTGHDVEFHVAAGEIERAWVWRGECFEPRQEEQIKTTFTALGADDRCWAWVDVERWSERAFEQTWLPFAPLLSRHLLDRTSCRRGPTPLHSSPQAISGADGAALAHLVCDRAREVPVVVVTPTLEERQTGSEEPLSRARAAAAHLTGIGHIAVLGSGAVSAFSRVMLEATSSSLMDVHSGAIRVYVPFVEHERPRRHRFILFERLAGRSPEAVARLVVPELLRAACALAPPPGWRALSVLLTPTSGIDTEEHEIVGSMLDTAETERDEARDRLVVETASREQAEYAVEELRDDVAASLSRQSHLESRIVYLERLLRDQDIIDLHAEHAPFDPDYCVDALEHARHHLDGLVIPDSVTDGAEELDGHGVPSWAKKALKALRALDGYVEAKREGRSCDVRGYLEDGAAHAVPLAWLAMHESETTNNNPRYRALRTLVVDIDVDPAGAVYMPSHIKLEPGGYPAPRMHFHDDTEGATGKVHIGWLGPHLDNASKS